MLFMLGIVGLCTIGDVMRMGFSGVEPDPFSRCVGVHPLTIAPLTLQVGCPSHKVSQ